jgi:putative ABC transport system permease protein
MIEEKKDVPDLATEAVVLSLFGGILGLVLVGVGVIGLNTFMDLGLTLSISNILFACGISTLIGMISGLIPAITASRMDPVEAIRFV